MKQGEFSEDSKELFDWLKQWYTGSKYPDGEEKMLDITFG
jgi:hypothetical protein